MKTFELNFDGIVGPTHNYSGLAYGNVASIAHKNTVSNPKEAALQGLHKMACLMRLGIKQAVLPPHERPYVKTLRQLGFSGPPYEVISKAFKEAPELFFACSSASSMWTANAATISPSKDTRDQRVHITPANLFDKFHRSIETCTTQTLLKKIFSDPSYFVHHPPLPSHAFFADEGAANHTRLCKTHDTPGVELFVFGRQTGQKYKKPFIYPARQTLEASQSIARNHQLDPNRIVFAQQNPVAIDAGVFHNDVISVGNEDCFIYHENAFLHTEKVISEIQEKLFAISQEPLNKIKVLENELSLKEAVTSYFFNSQIVTLPNGQVYLLAPQECQEMETTKRLIERIVQNPQNPIQQVHYWNLRQSMCNGGGPACLRLRVVLTQQEYAAIHPHILLTEELYQKFVLWVNRHYRDKLQPADLSDPTLYEETKRALDELTQLLKLGSIYDFQQEKSEK